MLQDIVTHARDCRDRRRFCDLALVWLFCGAAFVSVAPGPAWAAEPTKSLRGHVKTLTSERFEGRAPGSKGHRLALEYLVQKMKTAGLAPAGQDGFLTSLEVVERVTPERGIYLVAGERVMAVGIDYRILGCSDGGTFSSPAHFVGYGISEPSVGYEDYGRTDFSGQVVVALTGAPDNLARSKWTAKRKAIEARRRGARALVLLNDPLRHGSHTDQMPDVLPGQRPDEPVSGISVVTMTWHAASKVLPAARILGWRRSVANEDSPPGFALDLVVQGKTDQRRKRAIVHQAVGMIAGKTDQDPIIVGAHYDHLGFGRYGSRFRGKGVLHPGADDNASGLSVVLELAKLESANRAPPKRSILFVFTTAEEMGMIGAKQLAAFLKRRYGPRGVYINLDMVGRLRDGGLKALIGAGAGRSGKRRRAGLKRLRRYVREVAKSGDVSLAFPAVDSAPSDHIPFQNAGFQVVSFTTGRHADYHLPSDTWEKVDAGGLLVVLGLVQRLVDRLAR
jgi:aminopeptidase YwaD